jgi:MtfA peptidase
MNLIFNLFLLAQTDFDKYRAILIEHKLYLTIGFGVLLLLLFILIISRKSAKIPSDVKSIIKLKFPESWEKILKKNFPLYTKLPLSIKLKLNNHIQVFMANKEFEGADDLEIDEKISVLIAAQACLLICNLDVTYEVYKHFSKIKIFKENFQANDESDEKVDGISIGPTVEGDELIKGNVYLSWESVKQGISDGDDGYNPVYNQFARQLDQEDMKEDGIPENLVANPKRWHRIFYSYLKKFRNSIEEEKPVLLRKEAGDNLANYFAIATEYFFESPVKLNRDSPGLYREMAEFYKFDPAKYFKD